MSKTKVEQCRNGFVYLYLFFLEAFYGTYGLLALFFHKLLQQLEHRYFKYSMNRFPQY